MAWSKEQEEAINTRGENILVAAAAGSGKTAVLVERIIQLVLKDNIDISEILVVTFTNAAAAEMRERIGRRLEDKLTQAADTSDTAVMKKLQRQLILLNAAPISTLHSFCQSIVRRHFHEINVDPEFRVAGEQEINLLKQDVLMNLMEAEYDKENNEPFLQFVDAYGSERGDGDAYKIILGVYDYAMSQPFPEQWLKALPGFFNIADDADIDDTAWAQIVKDEVQNGLNECFSLNTEMQSTADQSGYSVKAVDDDLALLENIGDVLLAPWEELYTAMNDIKFTVMRLNADMPDEVKDYLKDLRQRIKKIINDLGKSFFEMPPDKLLEDMRGQREVMTVICELTIEFMTAFGEAKHERVIADFNDLEHFALQVLADEKSTEENLIPAAAAIAMSKKYKEVMVDEYQDTNGVQEAIISLVSGKNHNQFLVGDVKQSIYRFRMAEPGLFMKKYHGSDIQRRQYKCIDLSKNFRSRSNILQAVNFVFSQIMTQKAAEIDYGEKEALSYGALYQSHINTMDENVELMLLDKDNAAGDENEKQKDAADDDSENLIGFDAEADCIASRIKKLMEEGCQIFDKQSGGYRALAYKDIVILMRSAVGKADKMLEALRNNNIPSYAAVSSGYFAETEIKVMVSLLRIIDNPRQDIPLAAVLYSAVADFTAEDLVNIRLCSKTGALFDALLQTNEPGNDIDEALKDKAADFLQKLTHWRSLARQRSVPELIWQLYDETGYYDYCGGMPGGLLRQANLRMLYDRAAAYEETDYRGLFRFLRFIGKMQKSGNDLSVARTLGENEDVVRIMTIHRSKGLEFPVVIIADLGKSINLADSRQALLIHKTYGLGPYVYDAKYNVRYPTFARQAIARQIIRESKAEELRVLYVAMTRAREKLILTGSVKNLKKKAEEWCRCTTAAVLPAYQILNASTYLDWLCPAIARHKDGAVLYDIWQGSPESSSALPYADSKWTVDIKNNPVLAEKEKQDYVSDVFNAIKEHLPIETAAGSDWVRERLTWKYPKNLNSQVPSKLSVTEIKRRFDPEPDTANIFTGNEYVRPQFLQDKQAMTGTEYGTLMHSVMQHLDFAGDLSDKGIKLQLDEMAQNEIIAAEHTAHVNRRSIQSFIYSPLGERMRSSNKVRREMQFSRMLDADRFYTDAQPGSKIFIQGVIDLLFNETDGIVLVDYKTDNCNEDEAVKKYKIQIDLYSEAVEAILNRHIKEKYLYLFHSGAIVQL